MSRAADIVYNSIRERIISGALAPGEQLKEEDLARVCGVSRTPIREALRRLEADMLVDRTDTQRSFVAQWDERDLEDIYRFRAELEGHAAAQAARRMTPQALERLRAADGLVCDIINREPIDREALAQANRAFHDLVIELAASRVLARMIGVLSVHPLVLRVIRKADREQIERAQAGHMELLAAFQAGDPQWAEHAMQGHIRHALRVAQAADLFNCAESTQQG
ncbi:MAG TPA: GntR family transcriptional regulator [Novosphingobium sp.]|nr:GntR family transcriptional regulator [Novosphingobium sp.]